MSEKTFLENYNPDLYEKPSITSDILIFRTVDNQRKKELEVLLIKRKDHPFKDHWAIPGGFMDINETLEVSARRELFEETNLKNAYIKPFGIYSSLNRDPRMRVISSAYYGIIPNDFNSEVIAKDDAKEFAWFKLRKSKIDNKMLLILENTEKNIIIKYYIVNLKTKNGIFSFNKGVVNKSVDNINKLAFDHPQIIYDGLTALRTDLDYTPVALSFLSTEFTLFELKQTYEAIWGKNVVKDDIEYNDYTKQLDPSNFRKNKIMSFLEKTEKFSKPDSVGGAPARLYKLKTEETK